MDISNYDKAEVLAALYNNAKVQGLGILHADDSDMTREEASEILHKSPSKDFDYLKGRVMKINLSEDEVDTRLYNRDNGDGAAEAAIMNLKEYD